MKNTITYLGYLAQDAIRTLKGRKTGLEATQTPNSGSDASASQKTSETAPEAPESLVRTLYVVSDREALDEVREIVADEVFAAVSPYPNTEARLAALERLVEAIEASLTPKATPADIVSLWEAVGALRTDVANLKAGMIDQWVTIRAGGRS